MTDAPDPLGKRALFWAPAERDEDGPRHAAECDAPGKHALFSPEARAGAPRTRAGRSAGGATRAVERPGAVRGGGAGAPSGIQRGLLSPITVECSSCGSRSEVRVPEFTLLHLPVWLWRPGRGYTRFMTCPACRRRTWVSASWAPWAR